MSRFEKITSFQNHHVKLARKLHDKHHREQEKLFVVDYERDLERALKQGYEPEFILYAPDSAASEATSLVKSADTPVYEVTPDILAKASYRQNPTGMVAVLRQKPVRAHLENITSRHILGLVALQKPGNIGALLRTADATGFTTILLIDTALDIYNPNIIRASTGACFLENIYCVSSEQALQYLKTAGYTLIAGHLSGSRSLYEVDFCGKSALLLGTEDTGLSTLWRDHCDSLVKIPLIGKMTDSLNVSVAGAVFMYEALRQTRRNV